MFVFLFNDFEKRGRKIERSRSAVSRVDLQTINGDGRGGVGGTGKLFLLSTGVDFVNIPAINHREMGDCQNATLTGLPERFF